MGILVPDAEVGTREVAVTDAAWATSNVTLFGGGTAETVREREHRRRGCVASYTTRTILGPAKVDDYLQSSQIQQAQRSTRRRCREPNPENSNVFRIGHYFNNAYLRPMKRAAEATMQ